MADKYKAKRPIKFHREFHETNPSLILGLMIISLGLYAINWIYLKNREFEDLDKLAPDANRGAVIMMLLPFGWFFITTIAKRVLFDLDNLAIGIMEIVGWGFVLFLLGKYIIDFCLSFGRITKTRGILWAIPFVISIIICSIGAIFEIYFLFLFLIIPIIMVLAMQTELNLVFIRIKMNKDRHTFYH